jgi:hypothetical protein
MPRAWELGEEPARQPVPSTPEQDGILADALDRHAGRLQQVHRWPPKNRPWFLSRPSLTLLPRSVLPPGSALLGLVPLDAWYGEPDHGPCLIVGLNGDRALTFGQAVEWTMWYAGPQRDAEARAREATRHEEVCRSEEARKALARQAELNALDAARCERERLMSAEHAAEVERRLAELERHARPTKEEK